MAPGNNPWSRRRFVQMGAATALTASIHPSLEAASAPTGNANMIGVAFAKRDPRIGMIGVGGRGTSLLKNLLAADAQIVAICDVVPEKAAHAAELVEKSGQKR